MTQHVANTFPKLGAAVDYAASIHGAQRRKGTEIPYVSHLLSVAALVMEHGGDEDQVIAGLLHDAVEDCGAEQERVIEARFGDRVRGIVMACTDGVPDASGSKPDWHARKRAYLDHLRTAGPDALLVSACDKLHNARSIAADHEAGADVLSRFKQGREPTNWYYRSLLEVLGERLGPRHSLVLELGHAIDRFSADQRPEAASKAPMEQNGL
jgi:GTP pyrophosphokinase